MYKNLRETNLFIIINDESLETVKNDKSEVAKFKNEDDADKFASEFLESWSVVKIHFYHKFINHKI